MLECKLVFLVMVAPCPVAFPVTRLVQSFICTVTSLGSGRGKRSEAFHRLIVEYAHWVGRTHPGEGRQGVVTPRGDIRATPRARRRARRGSRRCAPAGIRPRAGASRARPPAAPRTPGSAAADSTR